MITTQACGSIVDCGIRVEYPSLTVLCGIPGSGKSSAARLMRGYIVSTDAIRKEFGDVNDMSRNAEVYRIVEERLLTYLQQRFVTIYDATNVRYEPLVTFLNRMYAAVDSLVVTLCIFPCTPSVAKHRIAQDLRNGHDRSRVPDDVVDQMYVNWLDLLAHIDEVPARVEWMYAGQF